MNQHSVAGYGTGIFRQTPVGRGYFLTIWLNDGSIDQFYSRQLVKLVGDALARHDCAFRARIDGYDGQVVVSTKTIDHLWAAQASRYGVASEDAPFTIQGPTLNPDHIEKYFSPSLLEAVSFAFNWYSDWFGPYWVVVRGPNNNVVIGDIELQRIYQAEMRARGVIVTTLIVNLSDIVFNATIRATRVASTQ